MKKRNLMMLALVTLAAGGLQANQEVAAAPKAVASKTETAVAPSLSHEEQAFAAKLSERARKSFTQMTAEQRKAAMAAATDPAVGADGAVDKVLKGCSASSCDSKK